MREKLWKIPYRQPELPSELIEDGYTPLLAAVLALRGIRSAAAADALLYLGAAQLIDPLRMKDMGRAAARLQRAIRDREIVAVYGDYDVDGITATALLTDYLRRKGLTVVPYIPDRGAEGYGVNDSAVEALHEKGVQLMVTVDCGITAVEECGHARELGIDVIITDHHECGGELPPALAVVDPKQPGEGYPNQVLAGVGVAMKLACACEGSAETILDTYADLVAVGTVADVMPLIGENRALVRMGIAALEDRPRPGMAAMLHEAGLGERAITAASIGFGLAPRLNAAGRLGQAQIALELLLTESADKARRLARQLCELNRRRQEIETEIWDDANRLLAGKTPTGPIVLAQEGWHQGVIGIAASRLAEQYSLPAIMICLMGESGKGSCRSYGGFNLFEALSACADTLTGFGGHALAAGLTLRREDVPAFRAALDAYYQQHRPECAPDVCCDLLIRDGALLSEENVQSLDLLEPYGSENPKPSFCLSGAVLLSHRAVGGGRHLRVQLQLGQQVFEGIFFGHTAEELGIADGDRLDVAFSPQLNEFRGRRSVQLLITALRRHSGETLCADILSGSPEYLWAAAPYRPARADFIRVWRQIDTQDFRSGGDLAAVLAQKPPEMDSERYCLCLAVLHEAGLLSAVYGGVRQRPEQKADLTATPLMQKLTGASM